MTTLHGYVLRELLKIFALTLVALTALFTMGGGLYNILRYEGIGPGDLFGFIPMLIPIAVTAVMPVAALFAACMVYGRLAADNELLACRSAGINIHRLFLSAVLLSVFVAGFTLVFGDWVIPGFLERMERYARANLRDIAYAKMQAMGHVSYEKRDKDGKPGQRYLLTARSAWLPDRADLELKHLPTDAGVSYLVVDSPVVLQIDKHDTLIRYASARYGLCQFDARPEPVADNAADGDVAAQSERTGPPTLRLTIYVDHGRDFDVAGWTAKLDEQAIGPWEIPLEFPRKSSMVDLRTLIDWRDRPWKVEALRPRVASFRSALEMERYFADCVQHVRSGQTLDLEDEAGPSYQVTAGSWREDEKGLLLTDVRVQDLSSDARRPLYYEAPEGLISPERPTEFRLGPETPTSRQLTFVLHLREAGSTPVREHNPRASDYKAGTPKRELTVEDTFVIPERVENELRECTEAKVLAKNFPLPLSDRLTAKRAELRAAGATERRRMASVIHFRLGSSASVLVTVLMAAALGVISRGSRALAAFGLACIPFGTVWLLMAMARQLAEQEGREMIGPLLTWGGLAAVAVIDVVILRLGVRR